MVIEPTVTERITAILDEASGGMIATLETRMSDDLDFHETAVWVLKAALEQAWWDGYNAGWDGYYNGHHGNDHEDKISRTRCRICNHS